MLVLSRRVGQRLRLVVNEQTIWITVLEIDPHQEKVRLGITADRNRVIVEREEIIADKKP